MLKSENEPEIRVRVRVFLTFLRVQVFQGFLCKEKASAFEICAFALRRSLVKTKLLDGFRYLKFFFLNLKFLHKI